MVFREEAVDGRQRVTTDEERVVIYPDPWGVITPSFHATPPNHLKFKGGYQGVFTGGVYVIVTEGVKY